MAKRRRNTLHVWVQPCETARESKRHSARSTMQSSQHLRMGSVLRNREGRHSRELRRRTGKVGRRSARVDAIHVGHEHLVCRVGRMAGILGRNVGKTSDGAIRTIEELERNVVVTNTRRSSKKWRRRRRTLLMLMLLRRSTRKSGRRSNLPLRLRWRRLRNGRVVLRTRGPAWRRPTMVMVHELWRRSTGTAKINRASNTRIVMLSLRTEHRNGWVFEANWRRQGTAGMAAMERRERASIKLWGWRHAGGPTVLSGEIRVLTVERRLLVLMKRLALLMMQLMLLSLDSGLLLLLLLLLLKLLILLHQTHEVISIRVSQIARCWRLSLLVLRRLLVLLLLRLRDILRGNMVVWRGNGRRRRSRKKLGQRVLFRATNLCLSEHIQDTLETFTVFVISRRFGLLRRRLRDREV